MAKITIELTTDLFETTIAKEKTFQMNVKDFPAEALTKIMAYGFQRIFNDRVGGSDKDAATKVELAAKMIEDYKNGIVGRQAAATVTDEVKIGRQFAKRDLKVVLSKEDFKVKVSDAADTNAVLDKFIAANAEHYAAEVEAEIRRRKAEAKKMAGINLTVDL